jgi:hypothetical protein
MKKNKPVSLTRVKKARVKIKKEKKQNILTADLTATTPKQALKKAVKRKWHVILSERIETYKTERKQEKAQTKASMKKRKTAVSLRRAELDLFVSDSCKSDVFAFTAIYSVDETGIEYAAGDELNCVITLERYFSYTGTTILINPNGFSDSPSFKSRLITQFTANDKKYLICLGSYALEGFKANATAVIIATSKCRDRIIEINMGGPE